MPDALVLGDLWGLWDLWDEWALWAPWDLRHWWELGGLWDLRSLGGPWGPAGPARLVGQVGPVGGCIGENPMALPHGGDLERGGTCATYGTWGLGHLCDLRRLVCHWDLWGLCEAELV